MNVNIVLRWGYDVPDGALCLKSEYRSSILALTGQVVVSVAFRQANIVMQVMHLPVKNGCHNPPVTLSPVLAERRPQQRYPYPNFRTCEYVALRGKGTLSM